MVEAWFERPWGIWQETPAARLGRTLTAKAGLTQVVFCPGCKGGLAIEDGE